MIEKYINEVFTYVMKNLTFKEEYAHVCKHQSDLENCLGLTKSQAQELKSSLKIDLKIAGKEKMFYQDYTIQNLQIRLMIPYGHGMIDTSYRIFKGMIDSSFPTFTYRNIAEGNKQNEDDYIVTFPTNTTIEEYESTLMLILKMNEEILELFRTKLNAK